MLNVPITESLHIIGDTTCYKLCEAKKTKKMPEGVLDTLGYYMNLTEAIDAALDYKIRTSDFKTLQQVKECIAEFKEFVSKNLKVSAGLIVSEAKSK